MGQVLKFHRGALQVSASGSTPFTDSGVPAAVGAEAPTGGRAAVFCVGHGVAAAGARTRGSLSLPGRTAFAASGVRHASPDLWQAVHDCPPVAGECLSV